MRFLLPLLAAVMLALPAFAQTPINKPAHTRLTMEQRFDRANTTNDGHLTLDQAKVSYKTIARHFAAIDRDNKGYVTLDDIRSYNKMQRALRHQSASTRKEPNS